VAKQAANWLTSELFGALNKLGKGLEDSPVCESAAELLALVGDGTISGSIAKQVLEKMLETGEALPPSSSAKASSRRPTPAPSKRRSTPCWPPMPTRWNSIAAARKPCSASSWARR
jgi:hypothetical protein